MIGALVAGWRFVVRHPAKTGALYAMNLLLAALVAAPYFLVAPGASAPFIGFLVGQLYIELRVIVRPQFMASQTALFQSKLAHASYVGKPLPKWPDSPSAEALRALGS